MTFTYHFIGLSFFFFMISVSPKLQMDRLDWVYKEVEIGQKRCSGTVFTFCDWGQLPESELAHSAKAVWCLLFHNATDSKPRGRFLPWCNVIP